MPLPNKPGDPAAGATGPAKTRRIELNNRIPEDKVEEIRRRANGLGISMNAWVCMAINEKLSRPEESFRRV